MTIEDIKLFLDNPIIKQLHYEGNKPTAIGVNKPLLKIIRTWKCDFTIPEIFYLLKNKNNLENINIFCPTCGKKNTLINGLLGYHDHCSVKCASNDKSVKDKIRNTALNNIDENGLNSIERGVIKCKLTRLNDIDKNGLNSYQRASIKCIEAGKNNLDEKGRNSYQRAVIKTKSTKKIRYDNPNFNNRDKAIKTNLIKRGVEHHSQTEEWKDLIKSKISVTTSKRAETNKIRYGSSIYAKSEHRFNLDENHKNFKDINEEFFRKNFIIGGKFDVNKCKNYFGVENCWVYKYKAIFNIDTPCIKNIEQYTVYNFIKSIYNGIIEINNRKLLYPQELDIYIPEKKLAIEFNGIYWHSSIYREKNYHQEKSKLCQEKGIRLIHIYEDEWNNEHKREIIKDIIKHALNIPIYENKIYARKCIIKEIENKEYNDFCNKYHIQGTEGAQVKLGLFYNNELVQIASFSKSRYDKQYEWEWIRGCPASNNNVIGGTSKLFKYFIRKYNPKSVLCYADFNKFDGKGYKECGFKFIKITVPDKFYFDIKNNIRINRNPFKYKEYTKNVKDGKFLLLYGAGNLKFTWNR